MTRRLDGFTTLTFDCYGTLIDWETGIWDALQPLIAPARREDLTRHVVLGEYAIVEAEVEARAPGLPYSTLLEAVHRRLAERLELVSTPAMDRAFAASIAHWPAFADTADALRRLARRFRLVILSNVDRAGFAASARKLGVRFDAIYTAEDIGSYKPDRRNFAFMLERLERDWGVGRDEILHVAQSLYHDHVPAGEFGLTRAWIDRQGLSKGGPWGATRKVEKMPEPEYVFPDLASLAEAVERGD